MKNNINIKKFKFEKDTTFFIVYDNFNNLNYIVLKRKYINLYMCMYTLIKYIFKFNICYLFSNDIKLLNVLSYKINYFNIQKNIYKYVLKLEVYGIGYKIIYENNMLIFLLGYSHFIKIKIPNKLKISVLHDKLIILQHDNIYELGNIMFILKSLKKINVYTSQGIKNIYEKINLKLSKSKLLKK